MYAVGKIPGGFNKREGKASENAILTSRVIDRPMRPLFPKDYRNDVTINNMVMSVDPECRPEVVAMIGSALAVTISDIPFAGPCAMTQMGMQMASLLSILPRKYGIPVIYSLPLHLPLRKSS